MTTLKPALALVENYHSSMKHKQLSTELKPESGEIESASSTKLLSEKTIGHIWKRMIDLFGNKWTSRMGSADDGTGFLAEAAASWQAGLTGITIDDLRTAFKALEANTPEWPPELRTFKALCRGIDINAIPTLDKVVGVLSMASSRPGNIAQRYQHALIFAISHEVDMYLLKTAKYAEARMMVKPIYEQFINTGWPPFPDHAFTEQKAIAQEAKPRNKDLAKSCLDKIKASIADTI